MLKLIYEFKLNLRQVVKIHVASTFTNVWFKVLKITGSRSGNLCLLKIYVNIILFLINY